MSDIGYALCLTILKAVLAVSVVVVPFGIWEGLKEVYGSKN